MSFLHPMWLALLVAATAFLTTSYTCVTPFAAFAVVAATSLSWRNAVILTVALWLVNQAVGFAILSYPWTAASLGWGVAIGGAAVVGTVAALWTFRGLVALRSSARAVTAFAAAFVVYEAALYATAVTLLGGTEAFAPRIVGQVLLINAATLVGLYGLNQLVTWMSSLLSRRRRALASLARPV